MNRRPHAATGSQTRPKSPRLRTRLTPDFLRRWAIQLGLPLLISVGVHVLFFALTALVTFTVLSNASADANPTYEATLTKRLVDPFGAGLEWPTVDTVRPFEDAANAPTLDFELDPTLLSQSPHNANPANPQTPGTGSAAADFGLGEGRLSLWGTGSGGSGLSGTGGLGHGAATGGTRLGQAAVWNLNAPANSVVYVIDFSGSIIVAVDDLKRELKRSIARLKPNQSFNVVLFYSEGTGQLERLKTESFSPRMQPATRAAREAFFQWLSTKAPQGSTEPLAATKRALSWSPDVIFFFSDGYFDDQVIQQITRANQTVQSQFYCLVFDELLLQDVSGLPRETNGARRMRRLAEQNRGKVKIVTGSDLRRR